MISSVNKLQVNYLRNQADYQQVPGQCLERALKYNDGFTLQIQMCNYFCPFLSQLTTVTIDIINKTARKTTVIGSLSCGNNPIKYIFRIKKNPIISNRNTNFLVLVIRRVSIHKCNFNFPMP